MQTLANIGWPRIVAEGAAIVASILLAFAIDAWWQDRQVRQEEQEILRGLQEEFDSIHNVLSQDRALHLERLESLENLLVAIDQENLEEFRRVLDATLLEMMSPGTSELGNGTLDALLSSGRMEIMTSRKLRAQLASWNGVISEVWDDQDSNAKSVFDIHIPYFVGENVAVGAMMHHWYPDWPIYKRSVSDDLSTVKRLLQDPQFRILVEIRYGYKRHLTGEFDAAIAAVEAILLEIENSIN
jgi:hypothetical protein